MYPVLFSLDLRNGLHISISSYSFMGVLSFTLWLFLASKAAERERLSGYKALACVFLATAAGFVGARLGHEILVGNFKAFLHPVVFFKKGALASTGGVILGFLSVPLLCRLLALPTRKALDIGALTLPLAWSVARIGCLLAGCCGGVRGPYPWALLFPHPDKTLYPYGDLRFPTQIYMSLANLLTFLLLSAYYPRRGRPGQIVCCFFFLFSVFHFFIQFLRAGDLAPHVWGPVRFSHLLFLSVAILSGVSAFLLRTRCD